MCQRTNLAICDAILILRATCVARRTFILLKLCFQIASLSEIFLLLLLSNLNLLIFTTSPQFIAPELVSAFVGLAAMLRNEA